MSGNHPDTGCTEKGRGSTTGGPAPTLAIPGVLHIPELALLGGLPVRSGELPTYPPVGAEEVAALKRVLDSGDAEAWTSGPAGTVHRELEDAFADYCGAKHAVAVNSGGMALCIALRAAGLSPGDEVLFQVDTCHAESVEVIHAGGVPVWADARLETGGLCETSARETLARQERVRFLVPIHTWGRPENLDFVLALTQQHKLTVIEDCCLALGAEWRGRKVGTHGVAGVFSFGLSKPLRAGEGGMIVTNDDGFARECALLRARGLLPELTGDDDVHALGWNGRLSAFAAAVALAQLRRYPELLAQLQANARLLETAVHGCDGLALFAEHERQSAHGCTEFGFRVLPERLGIPRPLFCEAVRAENVSCDEGSFAPTCRYDFFRSGEWKRWVLRRDGLAAVEANYARGYPGADRLFDEEAVYLPRATFLHEADARATATAIEKVCANAQQLVALAPRSARPD